MTMLPHCNPEIIEYRTNHAEEDWEVCLRLCTRVERYGLFGLFRKKVVDKEKLCAMLCEKHWYWEGEFGYFSNHWNYWFIYYPMLKQNKWFTIIPFPAQGLVDNTSKGMDVYRKYWHLK